MRIILDTDNEQNFVDLWNPEKNNWERYIKCEEKEETKTTTRESIEALGYACGEIQKCFTNGWEKSLKNKSLNEEDKNIKRLPYYDYNEINVEKNRDKFIEKILEKHDKRLNDYHDKINEIIDYIMEDKHD